MQVSFKKPLAQSLQDTSAETKNKFV